MNKNWGGGNRILLLPITIGTSANLSIEVCTRQRDEAPIIGLNWFHMRSSLTAAPAL